ncbi:MFS transporter [Sinanaerobacter chloroacetimidivorans]|uniref:MFS transporter n=1 Tax=Sinanaerobacter chloroacetimidivorans TaxID=2818044 RepID=A0A8J8B118_9FIRM|nr:MFS transporter [Sinanaerobacter chloroacetimidivorans]MBR0597774.1 MFS transporter [Sinanaerobacter chloroacetimidivorans]
MFKNAKFARYSIMLMLLGVCFMFFYSGLQNDHINILTPYLAQTYGWDDLKITNPVTYGALVVIILYLIIGAAFVKYGVKKILLPSIVLLALGCFGIALAGENYSLYFVSLFIVRIMVVPLQMGGFMLAANWFIKYRGRVLGIVTIGSPLFSIVGISALTAVANSIGLKAAYMAIAASLILIGALVALCIKDTPEDAGLFPDGADQAPYSEADQDAEPVTLKSILTDSRAWKLIISYGILQFVIVAMMAYMAVRYITLSTPEDVPNLFVSKALFWLSIGAAAGIPMSYVLGYIDDKLGSIKASLVLIVLYFFAVVPLAVMPVGGSVPLMAIWAFGVACMTGGMPTMHPCVTSYVYGRKQYMAANKWIMTIQAIPMAFAIAFMGAFNQMGQLTNAYYILMVLLVIAFITVLTMRNIPDANAADREYGKKEHTA